MPLLSRRGRSTRRADTVASEATVSGLIALRDAVQLRVSDNNTFSGEEKERLLNWRKLETARDPASCFGVTMLAGAVSELNFTDTNVVKLQVDDEAAWKDAFAGVPALQKLTLEDLGWNRPLPDDQASQIRRCFPSSLGSCRMLTHVSCRYKLNGVFPWNELSQLTLLEELDFTYCPFDAVSYTHLTLPTILLV